MNKVLVILLTVLFIFGGIIGATAGEDTDIIEIPCPCDCGSPAVLCDCDDAVETRKNHGITEEQRKKSIEDWIKFQSTKPSGQRI